MMGWRTAFRSNQKKRRTKLPSALALLRLLISFLLLFFLPVCAQAADLFPRGPAYYYSITKLMAFTLTFLGWCSLCAWVNQDVKELSLEVTTWNPIMLGAGVLGLLLIWVLPAFWLAWIVALLLGGGAAFSYVNVRNKRVEPEDQVLTERHLKQLANRYLKIRFADVESGDGKGSVPVRFMGRSSAQQAEDPNRVKRAQESKGYKCAQEMVFEAVQRRATDIHL